MNKPDIVVHGIRFYWDVDSKSYQAQVTPDDIEDVYVDGFLEAKKSGPGYYASAE